LGASADYLGVNPTMADMAATREDRAARVMRLLEDNAGQLERLVASYARSQADRADLRQDVALALWTALPRFRGECSERTFVLRVAYNRALAFITKRGEPADDVDDHDVAATSGKNPGIAYERREGQHRLLAAVRALPMLHRQVATMLLEGLSHREIADVLGITENNVAVRANRARGAMRVLLEEGDGR
jgi:RNA polymerase sigma factor (sigma-70 family)